MSNWSLIEHLTNYLHAPRWGDPSLPSLGASVASAIVVNQYDEKTVVGKCRRSMCFRYLSSVYSHASKVPGYIPSWSDEKMHAVGEFVAHLKESQVPFTNYQQWIFRQGDLYEDYIISQAKNSGVYIADQVPVRFTKTNISGKIDLYVINPETGKNRKTEVKSVHGFGGTAVIGTPKAHREHQLGTPRDSNLMQIALYDYKDKHLEEFEDSSLIYGSRDDGRYAEYRIRTVPDTGEIYYRGVAPILTNEVLSPINIGSIFNDGYKYVQTHVDNFVTPPRDYSLVHSPEQLQKMYKRGELSKTLTEQMTKIEERQVENVQRIADGLKPKVDLKTPEIGHWQCDLCSYKTVCYDNKNQPRDL